MVKKFLTWLIIFGVIFSLGLYASGVDVFTEFKNAFARKPIPVVGNPTNENNGENESEFDEKQDERKTYHQKENEEVNEEVSEETQTEKNEKEISDMDKKVSKAIKRHEESLEVGPDGEKVVNNVLDKLVLVNNEFNLPGDFSPPDLVAPDISFLDVDENDERRYMREKAAKALEELFEAAIEDQIEIVGVSGYRSYVRQERIFARNVERRGSEEEANKFSARPGQSEHQTGLAMDITSASVGFGLDQAFGETEEGQWVGENAADYGFIIRYPEDKEHITGYAYEPWHLRYVGEEHAKEISERDITLEEYLEQD